MSNVISLFPHEHKLPRLLPIINMALAEEGAALVRQMVAIDHVTGIEAGIRQFCREIVQIVHREPWQVGSYDAQRETVLCARRRHTASIARQASHIAAACARMEIEIAEIQVRLREGITGDQHS